MTIDLPHSVITPIPDTEPEAVPSLWNTRYAEIDENFRRIADYTGFAVCDTDAKEAAKTAQVEHFTTLAIGARVAIQFSAANSAASPTLDVSGTGAYPIWSNGEEIDADELGRGLYEFRFDGEHWSMTGGGATAGAVEKHLLDPDPLTVFEQVYGKSSGDIIGSITIGAMPIEPDPQDSFDEALTR